MQNTQWMRNAYQVEKILVNLLADRIRHSYRLEMNHAMQRLLSLFLFMLPAPMALSAACPHIDGNVVLFGGLGSTQAAMAPCYPHYLTLSENQNPEQLIQCLATQIDQSVGDQFVIAGHSSGAAMAEKLAKRVIHKDKIRLVRIDGYGDATAQHGVKTSCWYAENQTLHIKGPNAGSMMNPSICPQPAHVYRTTHCQTQLCLHLQMVNENVPSDIKRKDQVLSSFNQCAGNMSWINEDPPSGPGAQVNAARPAQAPSGTRSAR
jgi:hypothetical protein